MRVAPHQDLWVATLLSLPSEDLEEAVSVSMRDRASAAKCTQAIVLVVPTHGTWREDRLIRRQDGWFAAVDVFNRASPGWRKVPAEAAEACAAKLPQSPRESVPFTHAWFACWEDGFARLVHASDDLAREFLAVCWP